MHLATHKIPKQFGGIPLHAASVNGYTDVVEMLLDCGAVVDLPDEVYLIF